MSGGMDRDPMDDRFVAPPPAPDPLGPAKKLLIKEALSDKKKIVDARIIELTNELKVLTEKQAALNDMLSKL